ncbi:hypothetical protein BASA81_005591 [Batrachochytrium salamandrivorans]|nr:hypothetical protein BASA81_005591 [Batrachochytrium salamandrivorans]
MGNQQPFRCCSREEEEEHAPPKISSPTRRASRTSPIRPHAIPSSATSTSSSRAHATIVPANSLVSALRKNSRRTSSTSSLGSPLLLFTSPDPVSGASNTPSPPSVTYSTPCYRTHSLSTGSLFEGIQQADYDDDAETESESGSGGGGGVAGEYVVPPLLPANSSGLRRMLHASKYSPLAATTTNTDAKEEEEAKDDEPKTTGLGLRKIQRQASLLGTDVDSPKFAPFPVDKFKKLPHTLPEQLTFGMLVQRVKNDTAWLVEVLQRLGSQESFVRGATVDEVVGFEVEVECFEPDLVVLGDLDFGDDAIFAAQDLAKNLRVRGYLGCILLLVPTTKEEEGGGLSQETDFSIVDGVLEAPPTEVAERSSSIAEVKNMITIALAIAQRRINPSLSSSAPPSVPGSWSSTFGFGSMGDDKSQDQLATTTSSTVANHHDM